MVVAEKASIPYQGNEGAADMTPNTTKSPKGHVIVRSQPLKSFAGRVHQAGSAASSKWNKNGRDKPHHVPRTD